MQPSFRAGLTLTLDLAAVFLAWGGSYFIRFNFELPHEYARQIQMGAAMLIVVHAAVCLRLGLYRGIWAYSSLSDLLRILKASAATTFFLMMAVVFYRADPVVPRSILVLFPLLLVLLMGGCRLFWRVFQEHRLYGPLKRSGKPVVVIGAGRAGALLVRELECSQDWRVVALVDDDPTKQGLEFLGHPVVGGVSSLPDVLRDSNARHAILAMPSVEMENLRRATTLAVEAGAQVFTVPRLDDLMTGRITINTMRPVAIEDLLGRAPVSVNIGSVQEMLSGKTVLVTGAGGSIGSELCKQLARFSPAQLILYELSEFALYTLGQWFLANSPDTKVLTLAGDVRDYERMEKVFSDYHPHVVFHAAAYKHVPLMEVDNAWQAVRNNVLGTLVAAEVSQRHGVERFVLISTDKAVNPTNVMGATKRLAEMVCEALYRHSPGTQFEIVRFGNVLGSNGSVIPKFQEQISRGGPLTVTHPDITRYFMSIPEAAQLVLQAAAMGEGGEIFVLDMGEPVRILDMARNMIQLCGYTEHEIRIEFTGLRPGEKLFEELLADSEATRETPHPKLRIARPRPVPDNFLTELRVWLDNPMQLADDSGRIELKRWVPEYIPQLHRNQA